MSSFFRLWCVFVRCTALCYTFSFYGSIANRVSYYYLHHHCMSPLRARATDKCTLHATTTFSTTKVFAFCHFTFACDRLLMILAQKRMCDVIQVTTKCARTFLSYCRRIHDRRSSFRGDTKIIEAHRADCDRRYDPSRCTVAG